MRFLLRWWLMWIVALIAVLLLPVSLFGLRWALRAKRVDDHPTCRKCGFDLFNRPATSTQCPECGRDVTKARAVRLGNRTIHRPYVGVALLIILLSIGTLGRVGRTIYTASNGWMYAPDVVLMYGLVNEKKGADDAFNSRFSQYLPWTPEQGESRLGRPPEEIPKLSLPARYYVRSYAHDSLQKRGRYANAPEGYSPLDDVARLMTEEDRRVIFAGGIEVGEILVRPKYASGDPFPFQITTVNRNRHNDVTHQIEYTIDIPASPGQTTKEISGVMESPRYWEYMDGSFWPCTWTVVVPADKFPSQIPVGIAKCRMTIRWKTYYKSELVDSKTDVRELSFTHVADPEDSVRLITDPALKQALLKNIAEAGAPELKREVFRKLNMEYRASEAPANLSYAMEIRSTDGLATWKKHVACSSGRYLGFEYSIEDPDKKQKIFDVIFRPDRQAAASTLDMESYLDCPLEFKGLVVDEKPLEKYRAMLKKIYALPPESRPKAYRDRRPAELDEDD